MRQNQLAHLVAHTFGKSTCTNSSHARQKNSKFLATITANNVLGSGVFREYLACCTKRQIAKRMAEEKDVRADRAVALLGEIRG